MPDGANLARHTTEKGRFDRLEPVGSAGTRTAEMHRTVLFGDKRPVSLASPWQQFSALLDFIPARSGLCVSAEEWGNLGGAGIAMGSSAATAVKVLPATSESLHVWFLVGRNGRFMVGSHGIVYGR